jgi:hypothetical protein
LSDRYIQNTVALWNVEGKISRKEVVKRLNKYITEKNFSPVVLENLRRRRDDRSPGEFFCDISESIQKEHRSYLSWIKLMANLKYKVEYIKYGTDEIGQAFLAKKPPPKPDYLQSINGSMFYPVDVKNCPSLEINTFKKSDLKIYEKNNSAMLVCSGKASVKDPKIKEFIFYGVKAVKELNKFEGRIYYGFVKTKPAVRVATSTHKGKHYEITFSDLKKRGLIEKITWDTKKITGVLGKSIKSIARF